MSQELFEKASRKQFRFDSPQGQLTVEDLWELPLTSNKAGRANLDDIAKELSKQVKAQGETESFVNKTTKKDQVMEDKFELVKYIIGILLAEKEVADTLKANKEKKQQILALIADKQNEAMAGKSIEELTAMVEAL